MRLKLRRFVGTNLSILATKARTGLQAGRLAKRYAHQMTTENTRTVFRGRVITVNVETVRLPNGHVTDLEIIHHPGGAAIVAVNSSGKVCLIRQFRHAAGGWIWELPAGKLEPNEPPIETAKRELVEEAGKTALGWSYLGAYVSSPGVFTETVHLYLAQELASVNMA